MALTANQQDHLSILGQFARRIIDERDDAFIGNYEWAGLPDYDGLITQEALDAFSAANPNSPLAGAQVADIIEVEYVRSQLLILIDNKFPNLYAAKKLAR